MLGRYVVGLGPYWVLVASALSAQQVVERNNYPLRITFAVVFGARDVVVLLVWFWTNDVREAQRLRDLDMADTITSACGSVYPNGRDVRVTFACTFAEDIDLSPALNVALKEEIMASTSSGVRLSVQLSGGAARVSAGFVSGAVGVCGL